MAIVEATIKSLVREETGQPEIDEVSSDVLDAAFDEAVRDVNRRLSLHVKKLGTITTEAEEQEYELPSDCIRVIRLYWGPAISVITPLSRLTRAQYDSVAAEIGEELRISRRRKLDKFSYIWEVLDTGSGKRLVLGSVPTAGGKKIRFEYRAASSDSSLVPDELGEAIKEYMKWIVFRVRFAYWTANEGITPDAELRSQRIEGFRTLAEQSEERYNQILKDRADV